MRGKVIFTPIIITLAAFSSRDAVARPEAAPAEETLVGAFGGEGIRVDSAATGARIQVECLVARTDKAIRLDKTGGFTVAVRFTPLQGASMDEPENRPLSQLKGRVENDVLHLTIAPEAAEPSGTFTLKRDGKAKLPNCRLRS